LEGDRKKIAEESKDKGKSHPGTVHESLERQWIIALLFL
jgi:hypothetical protein